MDTKYCLNCGRKILSTSSFCNFCGVEQNRNITDDKNTNNERITFADALKRYFRHLYTISGCVTRKEYWLSYLWMMIFSSSLYFIWVVGYYSLYEMAIGVKILKLLGFIISIGMYFISISLIFSMCRRLHDANISGWFLLLLLIPILGWIVVIVLLCQPSDKNGVKKYGEKKPTSANNHIIGWLLVLTFGLISGFNEMNRIQMNYDYIEYQSHLEDESKTESDTSDDYDSDNSGYDDENYYDDY